MEFSPEGTGLELRELARVCAISHKGTLGLFPAGKKGKQRVVVGDDSGTVHCFEMKRSETHECFSFSFGDSDGDGRNGSGARNAYGTGACGAARVTALAMGGVTGGAGGGDRAFTTQGSSIVGLSKRGKEFFRMSSPLSETIHHMAVHGNRIWMGCDYICSAYDNGQDAAFYICPDRIASLTIAALRENDTFDAVLGCQDHCVRVVKADGTTEAGSEVALRASVDGPVGALCAFSAKGDGKSLDRGGVIYGTDRGTIGHLAVTTEDGTECLRKTWEFSAGVGGGESTGSGGRGVTAIASIDLTRDGAEEVVVGHHDGTVTVYRLPGSGGDASAESHGSLRGNAPREVYTISLGESVRSLAAGRVSTDSLPEVIACTFQGRVCSLTTRGLGEDLEKRVANERKRVSSSLDGGFGSDHANSAYRPPVIQQVQAITSCDLDADRGAYVISVEAPVPLDQVLLTSQVHMDLLESREQDGTGQVISRVSSLNPRDGDGTCATYRCEGAVTRLQVCTRTTEGDYGEIRLTIVAKTSPIKSVQVIRFSVKPLSLHRRLHTTALPQEYSRRRMNSLALRGTFTTQAIHDWLAACLPEVPQRVSEGEDATLLFFENVVTGGLFTASYSRGAALLQSDSASTLAIVKELISKEATARRVSVTDTFQGDVESTKEFLKLLHPKLMVQLELARQVELIDAIKEISVQQSDDTPWMFDEYREILNNADKIKQEFKRSPRALEYIYGIITDLFVDWHKFRGDDARSRIPELESLLSNYDYNKLVDFFLERH